MSFNDNKIRSGYEFVKEVVERNRFRSGDYLISAADGVECQWIEFKAVARVGNQDPDVQRKCNEEGLSITEACDSETKLNLMRIAKAVISLYNTRGGCILIGVCEEDGKARPTVCPKSQDRGAISSRFSISRISRYFSDLTRSIISSIKDLKALRELNSVFRLKCGSDNGCQPKDIRLDSLFERKIIFYKGIPIVALLVKWTTNRSEVVLCSEDDDRSLRLIYRKGADNVVCNWPLVANQRNLFDEMRNDAESNEDLYSKIIALSYLKRPNSVMRMLDKAVHLFDKSFVVNAAKYVLSPVSQDKLHARLRISLLYYGIYFLFLNALLIWFPGARLVLLTAIFFGLAVSIGEMKKRIEGLGLSIWVLVPPGIFILLSSVAPSKLWSICIGSIGLVTSLGGLSLMLKSPRLKADNESVLSQIVTLYAYLSVTIVQFPFVLFAISESGSSRLGNYILASVVNLIPVVSSIVASRIAIVHYNGLIVGCVLMFYLPYILLFISAVFSYGSEIVVVPKKLRARFAWFCEKVIILSVIGSFYMIIVSLGAMRDASEKKKWDNEIRKYKTHVVTSGVSKADPPNAEKDSSKERLTINDYFAQAFASYYYCYSNEVCNILVQYETGREDGNYKYNVALNRHYNGLKNIEYSFAGSLDDEDFEYDDFYEDDCFADFLSNKKLDVNEELMKLFLEYIEAIRQARDSAAAGSGDARSAFDGTANEVRLRLFSRFEAMKLKIDWRYIEWINRSRR